VSHQQHQQTHQQQQQIAGVDFCKFHTSKKNNIGLQESGMIILYLMKKKSSALFHPDVSLHCYCYMCNTVKIIP
jgi:hypothetical protein